MTSLELNKIMMRVGLRKVEITPSIYALASEINNLDKQLEKLRLPVDESNKENDLKVKDEVKTNSL